MSRPRTLFDTNVFLDWMFQDRPQHAEAIELFKRVADCQLDAFITPTSLATLFYVAGREIPRDTLMTVLRSVCTFCRVASQDADVVNQALQCEKQDLEDGLILCAARAAGCGIIVTRDERAFLGFEGHKVDERACLTLLTSSEG